jgi:hypothetical protein
MTGGAMLMDMPTCPNEDAKGSVRHTNAAKNKERSFIVVVGLIVAGL